MDCSLPGSSVLGNAPGQNTGVGSGSLLQGIFPNPGIEPKSPALQEDSLPSEPPGKPNWTEAGAKFRLSHKALNYRQQDPKQQ